MMDAFVNALLYLQNGFESHSGGLFVWPASAGLVPPAPPRRQRGLGAAAPSKP